MNIQKHICNVPNHVYYTLFHMQRVEVKANIQEYRTLSLALVSLRVLLGLCISLSPLNNDRRQCERRLIGK